MSIVKCKNQCLWYEIHVRFSVRIHFAINRIPVSFENQLYLCRIYDTAIQFSFRVRPIFFLGNAFNCSVVASFFSYLISFFYSSTTFCGLCLNTIDAIINIDTVNYGFFKSIVDYPIKIEEGLGFRYRSRRQSNHSGRREVLKNFSPISVNRTMALIDNNEVKEVLWQFCIFRNINNR